MAQPDTPPSNVPPSRHLARRDAVQRYYEASTRRFLRLGGSGATAAIHRGLWAEGVRTPAEAADHINARIGDLAETLLGHPPAQVSDMGCGVGGTLIHLAARWPKARLSGVTLSAEQVRIAQGLIGARGLAERVRVTQGDFLHASQPSGPAQPGADLAIAIESHVHAPDAGAFLRAAAGQLRPDGLLVIVDDMLHRPEAALDAAGAARLSAFKRGWHLGHVPDPDSLTDAARAEGFAPEARHDLTPLLRLDRLRDRVLRLAGPLADRLSLGRWPLFANMIGGNALTESYLAGDMRYVMLAFRRTAGGQG